MGGGPVWCLWPRRCGSAGCRAPSPCPPLAPCAWCWTPPTPPPMRWRAGPHRQRGGAAGRGAGGAGHRGRHRHRQVRGGSGGAAAAAERREAATRRTPAAVQLPGQAPDHRWAPSGCMYRLRCRPYSRQLTSHISAWSPLPPPRAPPREPWTRWP